MNLIQLIPYRGQGITAGVFDSVNGDGDLAIFNIGFDQSSVFANFEHDACAPDEVIFNLLIHADNEAGDDAGGQNRIEIFKSRDTVEFQFGGFVFREQVRDEEVFIGFDVVAQFELFHHVTMKSRLPRGYSGRSRISSSIDVVSTPLFWNSVCE